MQGSKTSDVTIDSLMSLFADLFQGNYKYIFLNNIFFFHYLYNLLIILLMLL